MKSRGLGFAFARGVLFASVVFSSMSAFAATGFRLACDGTGFEVPMVISSKDGVHAKVSADFDIIDDIATVDYQNLIVGQVGGFFAIQLAPAPNVTGTFSLRLNANLQGAVSMTSTDGDNLPYSGQVSCRRTR